MTAAVEANPFTPDDPHHAAWERSTVPLRVVGDDEGEPPTTPEDVYLARLYAALVDSAGLDRIPDPDPLIGEDILFRDSLNWMVGKPGCMKSFTALDMAGCVGTGETWQGYPVDQGPVLYLVAEGVRGTKKRVRAWEEAMGRPMGGVTFLPVAVQAAIPEQWGALVRLAGQLRPAMVVLDTQARITVGIEENSNAEMGRFVDMAERLRKACRACVLLVHHIGRTGDTGRGATTLDGAMSTIVKVSKDDDAVTLECQKNKDGAQWDDITLRAVPMGESVVLMPFDGARRQVDSWGRWVAEWWRVHADEWVSVSVLVKSGVVAESTFHRTKRELVDRSVVVRQGEGSSTRYRLPSAPPAPGGSHTPTP